MQVVGKNSHVSARGYLGTVRMIQRYVREERRLWSESLCLWTDTLACYCEHENVTSGSITFGKYLG